ncbi:sensor histidine kinase [Flavobacterium sp.]|uniref:sensor histidine kinase n=1 Tax=Flavobacterium sp. TaxID=239 RepID=UPI0037530F36
MEILQKDFFKSKESLISWANLLPYPFILAEINANSQFENVYFNDNLVSEFGFTVSEIKDVNEWFLKVYPNEDYRNQVRLNWQKEYQIAKIKGENLVKIKAKITSKTKIEKWYEIKAFFIENLYVFAFVDINNEVLMQEELKKINNNNDRMLTILSHDLKSPIVNLALISSVAGNYKIAKKDFSSMVEMINKESVQVLELLETTLNWAKLNFNTIQINNVSIDYNLLVRNIVSIYKTNYENKKIKVSIDLEDLITAPKDIEIMTIIIRNLFSNAIKFTPIGGSISIYNTDNQLIIKDSGVGMTRNKIESIKEINYHSTRGTENELGIGMGLHLVINLIEKIGCKFNIESKVNNGTTVKIEF